ncbi:MAG TPA: non-heme iron oxygenase ferredoxin subunit [Acidimicrobiales bacterium]|jgi:3-phenylpropionate/trans-cinnamate dioxygenase ferredoxin component|nr:non-heme iron oxygenase ferredoxin subunit [Acidimicrobiales bacterium]
MGDVVRLCGRDELAAGEARRFDVGAHRIALVRIEDDFYAIGDVCSHEDYSLSEGEVVPEACEIECWKHGSMFDLRTGEPTSLPATRPVPVYVVRVDDGDVLVELP